MIQEMTMIGKISRNLFAAYAGHVRNKRNRYELSQLDDRMLKDIGVHRSDIMAMGNHQLYRRWQR